MRRTPRALVTAAVVVLAIVAHAQAQAIVGQWLESFKEFPIRQRPASFNLDEVMQKMTPQGH